VNLRFIDWIWTVRGSLALAPEQSNDEAFDRLDSLFRENGTSHERTNDTLTFRKKDQAAQDKMSIFNGGVLKIEPGVAGSVLRYRMTSRALLLCFLAPLLFLAFAGLTIAVGELEKPANEAAGKTEKDKEAEKAKKAAEKYASMPMNPIDKALGAPAPEKPKKDEKKDKDKDKNKKGAPIPAYVFAGLFALLYVVGRILEDRLVKSLFRKRLMGA
jgi:hypothetical protein